jgi:hypothetical protein
MLRPSGRRTLFVGIALTRIMPSALSDKFSLPLSLCRSLNITLSPYLAFSASIELAIFLFLCLKVYHAVHRKCGVETKAARTLSVVHKKLELCTAI